MLPIIVIIIFQPMIKIVGEKKNNEKVQVRRYIVSCLIDAICYPAAAKYGETKEARTEFWWKKALGRQRP
jgi:hypothetical protein